MSEQEIRKGLLKLKDQLGDIALAKFLLEEENQLNEEACRRIGKSIREIEHALFVNSLNEPENFENLNEEDIMNRIRILTQKVTHFISRKDAIDLETVQNDFKNSETYKRLQNSKTNLWKQSVESIYIEYKKEKLKSLLNQTKNNSEILESIDDRTNEASSLFFQEETKRK